MSKNENVKRTYTEALTVGDETFTISIEERISSSGKKDDGTYKVNGLYAVPVGVVVLDEDENETIEPLPETVVLSYLRATVTKRDGSLFFTKDSTVEDVICLRDSLAIRQLATDRRNGISSGSVSAEQVAKKVRRVVKIDASRVAGLTAEQIAALKTLESVFSE
jgi:hypothetical protein